MEDYSNRGKRLTREELREELRSLASPSAKQGLLEDIACVVRRELRQELGLLSLHCLVQDIACVVRRELRSELQRELGLLSLRTPCLVQAQRCATRVGPHVPDEPTSTASGKIMADFGVGGATSHDDAFAGSHPFHQKDATSLASCGDLVTPDHHGSGRLAARRDGIRPPTIFRDGQDADFTGSGGCDCAKDPSTGLHAAVVPGNRVNGSAATIHADSARADTVALASTTRPSVPHEPSIVSVGGSEGMGHNNCFGGTLLCHDRTAATFACCGGLVTPDGHCSGRFTESQLPSHPQGGQEELGDTIPFWEESPCSPQTVYSRQSDVSFGSPSNLTFFTLMGSPRSPEQATPRTRSHSRSFESI